YIGLLASPTEKECGSSHRRRKLTECRDFPMRKKSLGELLYFQVGAHTFEIDADFPTASDCIKRHSPRVRYIKADRILAGLQHQGRLSVLSVAKGQALRRQVQI